LALCALHNEGTSIPEAEDMAGEHKGPRNPIQVFIDWFDGLPRVQQGYLAHMYWICTTENTADFVLEIDESLRKFRHYILRSDFPLRMLSRIVIVRSIFDFIMHNRKLISRLEPTSWMQQGLQEGKVVSLSEKQWDKTSASWLQLTKTDLSDKAISLWVQAITK
jgi:hypothetical protein